MRRQQKQKYIIINLFINQQLRFCSIFSLLFIQIIYLYANSPNTPPFISFISIYIFYHYYIHIHYFIYFMHYTQHSLTILSSKKNHSHIKNPSKTISPPPPSKFLIYKLLKLNNFNKFTNHQNSNNILPIIQDPPDINYPINPQIANVRTPTDKHSYLKPKALKTPNQFSQQKYFKSTNSQIYAPVVQNKNNKNTSLNANKYDADKFEFAETFHPYLEFRNSDNSQRSMIFYQGQKTDRTSRPLDLFKQSSKKQSKNKNQKKFQQYIIGHKLKKPSQFFKKSNINLKQTSSTISTINLNKKKSEQRITKIFKQKDQFFQNNKLKKSDFVQIKCMGKGKFGEVHLVKHKFSGFLAALKSISKKQIIQQKLVSQLIRQLKIQSFLNHPNIIDFYGSFQDEQNIYILLELGSQGQLYTKLKEKQKYSQQATAFIIKSLLSAVQYMHSKKLLHRDIKPQNIVIIHGIVKLCDFGWSVYHGNDLRTTFCGTPLYVSPEILNGNSYDQKTDLWAIGILAYELVIGSLPFEINKEQQLIKIIRDQIKFPTDKCLSEQYKDFVLKTLKKNPKQRIKSQDLLKHPFIIKYNQFQTCEELCQQ